MTIIELIDDFLNGKIKDLEETLNLLEFQDSIPTSIKSNVYGLISDTRRDFIKRLKTNKSIFNLLIY